MTDLERLEAELGTKVREAKPLMPIETRRRLDENFGRGRPAKKRRPLSWLAPAGALASLLVAAVIVLPSLSNNGPSNPNALPSSAGEASGAANESAESPTTSLVVPDGAEPAPLPSDSSSAKREVDYSASIGLTSDEAEQTAGKAMEAIDASGGYVTSSEISLDGALIQAEVPSNQLSTVVSEISKGAEVDYRRQSSVDVTSSFDPLRNALRTLHAERQGLLAELAGATSSKEREQLKAELAELEVREETLRAELDRLRHQVAMSSLEVRVSPPGETELEGTDPSAALEILVGAARVLLFGAILLAPFALLWLIWLIVRWAARRRTAREE